MHVYLRDFDMLSFRSVESMAVTSHHDGTYTISWVPTCPGSYDVCVCIDGTASGTCVCIHVHVPSPSHAPTTCTTHTDTYRCT